MADNSLGKNDKWASEISYDKENDVWVRIWVMDFNGVPCPVFQISDSEDAKTSLCYDASTYFDSYYESVKKFKEEIIPKYKQLMPQ